MFFCVNHPQIYSLTVVFLLLSIFLNKFFLLAFLSSGYSTCSKLFCFFLQKKRTCKSQFAFPITPLMKTYISIVFTNEMFSWHTFLMTDEKIKEHVSFESREKKKLLFARFSGKFVVLPARSIALANWFACMPACMRAIAQVLLTSLHLRAKFKKTIIVLIMGAIVH